jgi:hypothetical protein
MIALLVRIYEVPIGPRKYFTAVPKLVCEGIINWEISKDVEQPG